MSFAKRVPTCALIFILVHITRGQSNTTWPDDTNSNKVHINRTKYDRNIETLKNLAKAHGIIPNHAIFAMDSNLNDPHWVPFNNNTRVLPLDAIVGGYENETLYIIRFEHLGSLIPGKYVPSKRQAIISYNYRTVVKSEFEILCGYNYRWIWTTTENIPEKAVVGGNIGGTNEAQYVGRINYVGHVIPGKVVKSHKTCYVPYGDKEVNSREFEVLVVADRQKPKVTGKVNETVSKGQSATIECKIVEGLPQPTIRWEFKANGRSDFVPIAGSSNMLNISVAERKDTGVYKCIANNTSGSDEHLTSFIVITDPEWVPFSNDTRVLPVDAIVGGQEIETLYIIRSLHEKSLTPGKYIPSKHQAVIGWNGYSFVKNDYEILCGLNYKWVPTTTANIPTKAIVGGYIPGSNEALYVGRLNQSAYIIPGKVAKSHGVCFVAYGDKEINGTNFEILVVGDNKIPIVTGKANITIPRGQSANIECKIVEGMPYPKISWEFKANGHSDFISIPGSGNVLSITAAERKDTGVYKCIASNIVGNDEHITTLIVQTDPEWVQFNNTSKVLPLDAIVGGYENETLYIIRFVYMGSLSPGKYVPSKNQAVISYGSRTVINKEFEILCGHNYKWFNATSANIPAEAVVGGAIAGREPLYVGRIYYLGHIIPGKAVKSNRVCYVPYRDQEVVSPNFEILVVDRTGN